MSDVVEISPELQKQLNAIDSALEDLKNTNDPETEKRIEEFLLKHEELSSEYTRKCKEHEEKSAALEKAIEDAEKKASESGERIESLEALLAKKGSQIEDDERDTPEFKAFYEYLKLGDDSVSELKSEYGPEVFKTMRTDNNVQGGLLAPKATDTEIRKNVVEISPMRAYAHIRRAPVKQLEIWRRIGEPRAKWKGELETSEETESKYGSETLTVHALTADIAVSNDMLTFSAVDLEREIVGDISQEFARGENWGYVKGSGQKMPLGVTNDSRVETVTSGTVDKLDFDDIANLVAKMKTGYNPIFALSRPTLVDLWKIRTTDGAPIWQPISGEGSPAHIWGFQYDSNFQDLDSSTGGSGSEPIIFGDFYAGYEILDAQGIEVIRDIYTKKKDRAVEWTFHKYADGRVVKPEAIKKLKIQ